MTSLGVRRLASTGAAVVAAAALAVVVLGIHQAQTRLSLPLSHASLIREQARNKHLDPALIAAVIYAESKFEPRTSSAGAEGLMQILPETAYYLAHLSGGSRFTASDLATPSVNVAYGSYYLRYLLDHYNGSELLAVAAYNGGLANVDNWVSRARAAGHPLDASAIPFPETREYVQRVLSAQRAYREKYASELGI
jgi:soluble lytic murein transglycosylase